MWPFTYGATCPLRRFVWVGILHVCAEALKSGYFRDSNQDTYSRLGVEGGPMVHSARNIIHTPPYGLAYLGRGLCGRDVVLGPLARASVRLLLELRTTDGLVP